MKALGIDFGLVRVGFAISEGTFAEPLSTVVAKTKKDRHEAAMLLISKHVIDTVVIGQTPGTLRPHLETFLRLLKKTFSGKIVIVEEAMTTVEAKRHLIANNVKKKKRLVAIDSVAATIILQTYLDEHQA